MARHGRCAAGIRGSLDAGGGQTPQNSRLLAAGSAGQRVVPVAAGLLLLLVTAMPAAAFFKIAYDTVLESFIKSGQLQIALDSSDHEDRANDIIAKRISDPTTAERVRELRAKFPKWWGGDDTFFFCTRLQGYQEDSIEDASACPLLGATVWESGTSSDPATVPEIVEEVLPFYSESSGGSGSWCTIALPTTAGAGAGRVRA